MAWYRKLHWQIIIGLILGVIYGVIAALSGWQTFTAHWIAPFGQIFLNLLKMIAIPLVLASLITGVTSLSDLKKLSRIGGKTIGIYVVTTAIAVTIGLITVNALEPGHRIPPDLRDKLQQTYQADVHTRAETAEAVKEQGPLQFLVNIVPENVVASMSSNRNMLQVVFIALFLGVGLIKVAQIAPEKAQPVIAFFAGLNDVIIQLVDLIMLMAPLGVFALIADTITSVAGGDLSDVVQLLGGLGYYSLAVVVGLAVHTLGVYPTLLKLFTPLSIKHFFSGIAPAQIVAFTTSSSGATLPVTMEVAEKNLGVSEEVSSFVLPLGATINMDGTALYQAVAAVFIAQALGMDLSLGAQLTIILTAVLASIGTAAVPGAGIIMLVIILEAIGVPTAGIALILGVDRILDMVRTVTNVTGDLTVASIVAATEGQLHPPETVEVG